MGTESAADTTPRGDARDRKEGGEHPAMTIKLWNWDMISVIFISYVIGITFGFFWGYFFIYPSRQPNAFSFEEIFITAAIILLVTLLYAFMNASFLRVKLTGEELKFNKIIKNVKIDISNIGSAELRVNAEKNIWKRVSGGGIKLYLKNGDVFDSGAWYLIVLKIGEILNERGIKATYELCEVSKESRWNLDCRRIDDWKTFKSEVYKRLENVMPINILREIGNNEYEEGLN